MTAVAAWLEALSFFVRSNINLPLPKWFKVFPSAERNETKKCSPMKGIGTKNSKRLLKTQDDKASKNRSDQKPDGNKKSLIIEGYREGYQTRKTQKMASNNDAHLTLSPLKGKFHVIFIVALIKSMETLK